MRTFAILSLGTLLVAACAGTDGRDTQTQTQTGNGDAEPDTEFAAVVSVQVSGGPGAYSFNVGVLSPDTGCEQYANWWEVISDDGTQLLYRRILTHSHVPPDFLQPFVRSGGTADVGSDEVVIIRAHMNTSGFGPMVLRGSADTGFVAFESPEDFAAALADEAPQPGTCPF